MTASKEWSGTRADLAKKAQKMERAVRVLLKQHREADQRGDSPEMVSARERQVRTLRVAEDLSHAICPAGKRLYRNGANIDVRGYRGTKFSGTKRDCEHCPLRARCLRHPERTVVRQFVYFRGRTPGQPPTFSALMKSKIDSPQGRYHYSRRLGTVEPVFANIRSTRGLDRFTLRGRTKVNVQWQLYALVHNIGKIQKYAELGNKK